MITPTIDSSAMQANCRVMNKYAILFAIQKAPKTLGDDFCGPRYNSKSACFVFSSLHSLSETIKYHDHLKCNISL